MGIRDRLKALERRAAGQEIFVVLIRGGLPEGLEPIVVEAAEHRWVQESDEPREAFEARVVESARAAGLKSIVIGGLPL